MDGHNDVWFFWCHYCSNEVYDLNTMTFIRLTQKSNVTQLPTVENSTAKLFKFIPKLAWIVDGHVQTEHQA
ncbi:hypothetical protein TCT1_24470 [Xenorhabdus sp. TCT-1]|uniref:Uncharacterized protein n=1 Tax=Xenorhabdus taiwanensis TaxID=3085177 RepID=A0ABM8JZR5_9GAMM|nr:hypothetical protein TCT1_24470 [Xenorhabdus sp. TCT-1]